MSDDPNTLIEGFQHLRSAIGLLRDGISLWRDVKDAKVPPERAGEVERIFQDADRERRLAEAAIGKAFGYHLCRCSLPPQVCLMIGFSDAGQEQSECPACGQVYPVPIKPPKRPHPRTFRA